MTFQPLELQDCQNIAKTFERASAYCVTEESVFAMMTPLLTGIRAQTSGLISQIEAGDALSNPKSAIEKGRERPISSDTNSLNPLGDQGSSLDLQNMDKASEDDGGILTEIKGNFFPGAANPDEYPNTPPGEGLAPGLPANIAGGIFNSECIPCGTRLNMLGELSLEKFLNQGRELLEHWLSWLSFQMKQLMSMIDLFTNADKYIDLCALLRWLNDFICIPDLQRILSVLMALMSRVSFELGGVFDIILGLIGPLLGPFLSGFVDLLQSYVLLIVRPIECIIDNLQDIIRKVDYNVFFQNIDSLDKHVSLGQKEGAVTGTVKIPFINVEIDLHEGPGRTLDAKFNLFGPIGDEIKRENARNSIIVEEAAEELRRIKQAGMGLDASDIEAMEKHRTRKAEAEVNYRSALEKKSLSALGRLNQTIDLTQENFKSSLFTLIGYLREAVEAVSSFFQDVFDELKKIMGEYVGGGNAFVEQLIKKIGLVQMIAFISAVISAFASNLKCGDDEEKLKVETLLPEQKDIKVWTDDQGNIHIQEDKDELGNAVDSMVEAIGTTQYDPDPISSQQKDKGTRPENEDSRQKLKSLIEFTGDPLLDLDIARATEALTSPVDVVFKCPLQTTVAQAERVNRWMQELDSE